MFTTNYAYLRRAAVVVLVTATATACASTPASPHQAASSPSTFTATGTLAVPSMTGPNDSCVAEAGFDDIRIGTQVVIADASGTTIATGSLESSKWRGGRGEPGSGMAGYGPCLFTFEVPDVPTGKKFYELTIADRGTMTYSAEELRRGPALGLGLPDDD